MIVHFAYFILFVTALASALGVVVWRNPVHAAISLVVTMLSLAGLYLLMQAELVAAIQVIVYAGAIVVLFLYVIMHLNLREPDIPAKSLRWLRIAAIGLGVILLEQFLFLFASRGPSAAPESAPTTAAVSAVVEVAPAARDAGFDAIGIKMITQYALPFELTSILLLVAIIGAVVLSRSKDDEEEEQPAAGPESQ